jgi:Zn-finger nucleic acid-binding protein
MWVDGEDIVWLYPALRHHGARIGELLERGARRETALARCPHGHERMLEFPFFDLWLDLCESCHGLWIDGDELDFVQQAAKEEDGLPKVGGAYRDDRRVATQLVCCSACQREVHPRRTYLSAEGVICDSCVEIDHMSRELGEDTPLAKLKRAPGRVLRFLGDLLDRDGKRLARGGFTNWNL